MSNFENPTAGADEVQAALRALAHSTRSIEDPRQIYSVLGSLTSAIAALSQSVHQIASHHDGSAQRPAWVPGDSRTEHSAAYQVSWELHRAGEILRQVAGAIDRAYEAEGTITYVHRDFPQHLNSTSRSADRGLGL